MRLKTLLNYGWQRELSEAEETMMVADGIDILGDIPQQAIERAARSWLADRGTFEQVNWGDIRKRATTVLAPKAPPVPDDDEWPFKPAVISAEELQRRREMAARLAEVYPALKRVATQTQRDKLAEGGEP